MQQIQGFQDEQRLYFVMEYLHGGQIRNHFSTEKPFSEQQAKQYVATIAMGIGYLHSQNIIHGHLKPGSILLDQDGYVKLTSFNKAHMLEQDEFQVKDTLESNLYYTAIETL